MESEWYGVYHSFRGGVNGSERMKFSIYDGDGISEWYEIIKKKSPEKSWVYICWLIGITYSSHSSNIGVYLLVIYGVGGISGGIIRSGKVVINR